MNEALLVLSSHGQALPVDCKRAAVNRLTQIQDLSHLSDSDFTKLLTVVAKIPREDVKTLYDIVLQEFMHREEASFAQVSGAHKILQRKGTWQSPGLYAKTVSLDLDHLSRQHLVELVQLLDHNNFGDSSLLLRVNQKLASVELSTVDYFVVQKCLTDLDRITPEFN